MRIVSVLHPELQDKITVLLNKCIENGLKIGISETLRTREEQDALYAKGRTSGGKIVTNAKGSDYSSMHQWGVAFDFYRADGKGAYENGDGFFEKVGVLGENAGLLWGGRWKSIKDLPHFQLSNWGESTSKLKHLYGVPFNFFETWRNEMTENEKQEFNALKSRVQALENNREKIYNKISELPDWAKETVRKMYDAGVYRGAGEDNLNLSETLMRMLVIGERMNNSVGMK